MLCLIHTQVPRANHTKIKNRSEKVFEVGQVYVALSRAVSLDALEVRNFDPSKIKCDEKVKKFYLSMKTLE